MFVSAVSFQRRRSLLGHASKRDGSLVTSLNDLGYYFKMLLQRFNGAIQVAGIVLALVGCNSNSQSADNSIQPKPTSSASSTIAGASPTITGATAEVNWEEVCKAAYAAQIGNASMSDEVSWVNDCSAECALPEFVSQCEGLATELGFDVP